jgi:hypothetical protein
MKEGQENEPFYLYYISIGFFWDGLQFKDCKKLRNIPKQAPPHFDSRIIFPYNVSYNAIIPI